MRSKTTKPAASGEDQVLSRLKACLIDGDLRVYKIFILALLIRIDKLQRERSEPDKKASDENQREASIEAHFNKRLITAIYVCIFFTSSQSYFASGSEADRLAYLASLIARPYRP